MRLLKSRRMIIYCSPELSGLFFDKDIIFSVSNTSCNVY